MNHKTLTAAAALVITAGLTGCNTAPKTATAYDTPSVTDTTTSVAYHNGNNVPAHGVALDGYCPVAYFAVNKPVRGQKQYSSTHEGITYHLVSADAKAEFDKNPDKYVPAYGGWCAFGMSVEDKFPVDPRNFKIVDGQLMLFLKNDGLDARELWNKGNQRELTTKAGKHWKKVQG